MLSAFIERTWATTIIYFGFAALTWYARNVTHSILAYGLLAFATLLFAQQLYTAISYEQRLDALGKRSPRVKDYTPFGLGTLARAIWYFSHHRNHEFWWKIFGESGNPRIPYTVEAITVGQRIIFTADEENIKAILATQFQDFGKGPQFRKEWKDFLGLSKCRVKPLMLVENM